MNCMELHPAYYEELAKIDKVKDEDEIKRIKVGEEWELKWIVSDLAQSKEVHSKLNPGTFNAATHVPSVSSESSGKFTVTVPHIMKKDHWIEYVWVRDNATGKILAVTKLSPDDSPSLTFEPPPSISSFTAFESCNL